MIKVGKKNHPFSMVKVGSPPGPHPAAGPTGPTGPTAPASGPAGSFASQMDMRCDTWRDGGIA